MKTRIKKIVIMAVALLFVSVGVSFAHDRNRGNHKSRSHANGHYKKGYDDQYDRHHNKRSNHHRKRHHYREVHRVQHHYHHRAPHEGTIFGFKLKEPGFKFAVIVKDR